MAVKFKLLDSSELSKDTKPYVIAEMNTSHFGSMETAKKMIIKAKESGCNCVKFQSWTSDTLYSKTYYGENPIAKRMFNKFSLSEPELLEVANFSRECGISFASTPYSIEEVDFLINDCKAAFIKVASMDLNNYPFLDYIAKTNAPIILSTGMGEISEIKKAVETIEKSGNTKICILHCISIYPSLTSEIRLKNILGLQKEFSNYLVGYSDHSLGIEMASAATALGSVVIEKHFTLDKTKIGMDNQMACEPYEMKQLVQNCHNVHSALGAIDRIVMPSELEQRK
ncbi:N-acetylneuraminate synthase family protein, partial [bacterium]|nr:N-acetylneuraminate synthase family protein [bacterium]